MQTWEQKHNTEAIGASETIVVSMNNSGKARKFNLQRFISIAAAIVGIAFLPLGYSMFFSGGDVYNEMFAPPTAIGIVRGNDKGLEAKEKAKNFALGFYLKKDYDRSIELLNTYIDEYGDKEYEAIFYLGVSQMSTEKFKPASMNFEHVLEGDKGYFAQGAEWMLALTQYKLGNKENAIRYAEKIVLDSNHNYYNSAKTFLEKVK
jgi:TolA-binding protein